MARTNKRDVDRLLLALRRHSDNMALGNADDPADVTLLRRLKLVQDYPMTDPYDRGKVVPDKIVHKGALALARIVTEERRVQEIKDRLDAIAAEMDRGWNEARGAHQDAPVSNLMSHPGWAHWHKELRKADRRRQAVEREVRRELAQLVAAAT